MNVIEYRINGENKFYDFSTINQILKIDRSKLQRDLKRISGNDFIKYKNQYLYNENILFQLMEEQIIERLDKIETT